MQCLCSEHAYFLIFDQLYGNLGCSSSHRRLSEPHLHLFASKVVENDADLDNVVLGLMDACARSQSPRWWLPK